MGLKRRSSVEEGSAVSFARGTHAHNDDPGKGSVDMRERVADL